MSDSTELTTATLAEKIRDRVKAEFLDLIPDEQWEGFVNRTIGEFTTTQSCHPSRMSQLIANALEEEAKMRLDKLLSGATDEQLDEMLKVTVTPELAMECVRMLMHQLLAGVIKGTLAVAADKMIRPCANCGNISIRMDGMGYSCDRCGNWNG